MPLDLARIGRKSYVSQNALAAVLKAVREAEELPAGISRPAIKRSRVSATDVRTPYGPLFQTFSLECEDGGSVDIWLSLPAAMLWHLTKQTANLASFIQGRLQARPCSVTAPWTLVFYTDEVSPGNQLKVSNARKLQAIYFSFREFGIEALSHERAWFLLGAVKSSTVLKITDGMAQLCKVALLSFYADGASLDKGIQLRLPQGSAVLCATVGCLLSDESALKHMLGNKGASGKVPCVLCRNVVQKRYAPTPMRPPLVHHTCWDETKFLQHDRASLAECVSYLADQSVRLNKGQFQELQTRLGFNHAPTGVLSCAQLMAVLDVPKAICYDYMHVYCVAGLFHHEVNTLLQVLSKKKIRGQDFHEFLRHFNWPNFVGSKGAGAQDVFQKVKKTEDTFKCSASEVLGAYPVMRVFAADLLENRAHDLGRDVVDALKCFLLHCGVLDVLHLASKDDGANVANRLRQAIVSHLKAYAAVHGDDGLPPKSHMAVHLASMLEHQGQLLSCWVHERRHKELKRFANNLSNMQAGSELSIMREMLLSHEEELNEYPVVIPVGLWRPRAAAAEVRQQFADTMQVACCHLQASSKAYFAPNRWASTGDRVVLKDPPTLAEIVYHCEFQGHLLSCVRLYAKQAVKENRFSLENDALTFVHLRSIEGTCIWRQSPDGSCVVAPQVFEQ